MSHEIVLQFETIFDEWIQNVPGIKELNDLFENDFPRQRVEMNGTDGAVSDSLRGRISNVQRSSLNLSVTIDQSAHPWHTILRIEGADRQGLLRDITAGLARCKIFIHHAKISTIDEQVRNEFEVSDRLGRKISLQARERVKRALR